MSQSNSTTVLPDRERGQHLTFQDRCSIRVYQKLGYSLRATAEAVNCSPSTVLYELRRGTGERKGSRGRFPEYSAKRGQQNYEVNRTRCHRSHIIESAPQFVQWLTHQVKAENWSLDACVGYARRKNLFPDEPIPCTKTLYNELWQNNLPLTPFDVPEALPRKPKRAISRRNKRILGKSIDARPAFVTERTECGHWEIDTVVGQRKGKESVVLTVTEKVTDYYIAVKIPGKNADAVMAALEVLREEYGHDYFAKVFKTITADNGNEFARLAELETYGIGIYFAHPYSSWERAQNERHNRMFRQYVPKGVSIENYTADQIQQYAAEMNALPRKRLGYYTPEELFDQFLDEIYSIKTIPAA